MFRLLASSDISPDYKPVRHPTALAPQAPVFYFSASACSVVSSVSIPVSQFDFPAMTVQIRHFSSGKRMASVIDVSRWQTFPLRVTVSRRALPPPSPGHFSCPGPEQFLPPDDRLFTQFSDLHRPLSERYHPVAVFSRQVCGI